jgi:hypothetical protein
MFAVVERGDIKPSIRPWRRSDASAQAGEARAAFDRTGSASWRRSIFMVFSAVLLLRVVLFEGSLAVTSCFVEHPLWPKDGA